LWNGVSTHLRILRRRKLHELQVEQRLGCTVETVGNVM